MWLKFAEKTGPAAILVFLLLLAGCSDDTVTVRGDISRFVLDNGMEVILKENHASPMVTSLIFVKAGSKYENRFNNGVTHFLEHLLFNGTATRTQEELDHGIERLGGYINAFTSKEFTAYLVSMPKDFIEYGMATQADMLFNSVFPEESFEKERKIIIEEIKMNDDAEGAPAEAFFEEKALAGTPYSRPVIGYESTIANIPRKAIIDYYKRFYAPNNMTQLIIGDFESQEMTQAVKSIFGRFQEVDLASPADTGLTALKGGEVFRTPAKTKSTYIKYSIIAPHFSDSDYYAFNLIEDYLSDGENSPLVKVLKSGASPLATSISAYLDTKEEWSRLNIDIITEKASWIDSILYLTDEIIRTLSADPPSKELLNGYKVSRRCHDIYMSEKLHHYGFTIAPLMAVTGWDFFSKLQDNIDSVSVEDIVSAGKEYLDLPSYIATVTYPETGKEEIDIAPGPTSDEVIAYYKGRQFPEYDLSSGKDFKMPEVGPVSSKGLKHSTYLKEVLGNGMTVVVKSNPYSRVFALNVIGKNRSASEPPGREGITDFVNRMIEKGTTSRSAEELSQELASIGANVTLYDNPWIPFDDRYTTRQYSFMKFETIDQFTERGIELFSDMIFDPAFDSSEVEEVRSAIFGLLARNSGSTYKTARNKFYESLFAGTAYAGSIEGNFRTIKSINVSDLKEHHHRIYSPENIIVTIGTNRTPDSIMAMLKEKFGAIPSPGALTAERINPKKIKGVQTAHAKMEKGQVYIYLGNMLPSAVSPEAPVLKVANAILSERMRQQLRERQGLAYSVGSSVTLDRDFGWYICSMGTGVENYETARNGIIEEIERLKTDAPSSEELEEAVNAIWGSYLMANLSRINQAFYMGVNEYLGLGYNYGDFFIDQIRSVTPEQVVEAAKKYFDTENYVIATAGNI